MRTPTKPLPHALFFGLDPEYSHLGVLFHSLQQAHIGPLRILTLLTEIESRDSLGLLSTFQSLLLLLVQHSITASRDCLQELIRHLRLLWLLLLLWDVLATLSFHSIVEQGLVEHVFEPREEFGVDHSYLHGDLGS